MAMHFMSDIRGCSVSTFSSTLYYDYAKYEAVNFKVWQGVSLPAIMHVHN